MRYFIYTRVSTNKQTVANQLRECLDHVNKIKCKGDEIIEFSEPDTSTRKPMAKRPKLMDMMSRLREGDRLIVYKVDRLARDPQELINIYCDIVKKGVEVVGLNDPNLNTQTICIYAFIACSERENIQVRTKSGLQRKKALRERIGAVPYGFKLDEDTLSPRETTKSFGKPYLLLPDEAELENVRAMIELDFKGLSYQEIVDEMKDRGCKNRKGKPFQKMSVYRILQRAKKEDLLHAIA